MHASVLCWEFACPYQDWKRGGHKDAIMPTMQILFNVVKPCKRMSGRGAIPGLQVAQLGASLPSSFT